MFFYSGITVNGVTYKHNKIIRFDNQYFIIYITETAKFFMEGIFL